MSISLLYQDFLERMDCYRKKLGLTQTELASLAGLSQSQISKRERGINMVPFEMLEVLEERGCDITLLLIGEKQNPTELNDYYKNCPEKKRTFLLILVLWGMLQCPSFSPHFRDKLNLVHACLHDEKASGSTFYALRKIYGLTQFDMAGIVRLDIKKYVRMEQGETRPDAEILLELYDRYAVLPETVLCRDDRCLQEINLIWQSLTQEDRQKLLDMLNFCSHLFLKEI